MTKSVDSFPDISQEGHDRLCWAAVALGVDRWRHPASTWTLCRVVVDTPVGAAQPSTAACCNGLSTAACNHLGVLFNALRVQNLQAVGIRGLPRALPHPMKAVQMDAVWNDFKTEIDQNRVVCVGINWHGGGYHYVVVWGYNEDGADRTIYVKDPLFPNSSPPFEQFVSNYRLAGDLSEVDHVA